MHPVLTPHQSQYYAWLLTRRTAGDSVESLASTLVDSQVDLNPHQVEAALFACANPLSRGVTDRITGSRTADTRAALVEHFKERGTVMIATEAGAEGINLQFCSLVINFDLPWNPQRIEQRIGRCHRYGQKHDVVVVSGSIALV